MLSAVPLSISYRLHHDYTLHDTTVSTTMATGEGHERLKGHIGTGQTECLKDGKGDDWQ